MSHLGRRLSALVDGELSAAERDRAHAHLARCAACRTEAKELRELKRRMRGLADLAAGDELTQHLIAIPGPAGPVPLRRRPRRAPGSRGARLGRVRYVALGVASCVVTGLGVTAFSVGGGPPAPGPGPRVTPPVEMYSVEHAITTGQIPVGGTSMVPVPALTGSSSAP